MAVKAGILMLAAAMWVCLSAVVAFDVPSVAFDEGFSPLFGDDNLVRARDDRTVRLLLDRRSGNPSPSSQIFSP
jgi:xyloglucan:xyloglucosyl transferase